MLLVFQNWLRGLPVPNLPRLLDLLKDYREPLLIGVFLWGILAWITFQVDAHKRLSNKVWFYKARSRLRPRDINPSPSWYTPYFSERTRIKVGQVADLLRRSRQGLLTGLLTGLLLRSRQKQEMLGVLLLGVPLVGKTRWAYEVFKRMWGYHVLGLEPGEQKVGELKIPRSYVFLRPKVAVFLDDLQAYIGGFTPNYLYRHLDAQTRSLVILATCRTGDEWKSIKRDKNFYSFVRDSLEQEEVPEISKFEEKAIANRLGRPWSKTMYNCTPGSIVFDLGAMREKLESAGDTAIALMRALFLLRRAGIQKYRRTLSEHVAHEVYELDNGRNKLESGWRTLSDSGFLTIEYGNVVPAHAVYIEQAFWDGYEEFDTDEDLEALWQLVCKESAAPEMRDMVTSWLLERDYKRALEGYEEYLSLVPEDTEARLFASWARLQVGEDERAEGNKAEADKIASDAEQEFRSVLRDMPDEAAAHYALAMALRPLNRSQDEIQEELREAIRLNPQFAPAHDALGRSLYSQGRLVEAEQEYFEALRCDDTYPNPHRGLYDIFQEQGRSDRAYTELQAWRVKTE